MAKYEPTTRTVLEPLAEFIGSSNSSVAVSSIQSLAVFTVSDSQSLIYVGTASGTVLLLSLNPISPPKNSTDSDNSKLNTVSLLRSVIISNGSVNSILVISHIEKVIVVSDGYMHLVDSLLLEPVKKLSSLRGISVVCRRIRSSSQSATLNFSGVDNLPESLSRQLLQKFGGGIRSNGLKIRESDMLHRDDNCVFAAAVGKKLVLVELVLSDGSGGCLLTLKEIQCRDGITTMLWLDDSIIVGTLSGYSLYSCLTGQSVSLFSLPDSSSPPCLKLLSKECKVLMLVDNVGIIVNAEGQPVGGSLIFRYAPNFVGEIASFVVTAKNGKIELYHKKSGTCIQVVSFAGEGHGLSAIADEESGSGTLVALATLSKVICFRKVPSEEQIKDLLRKKNFKDAISLSEELYSEGEMTEEMLSFVYAQVGFLLLFDLQFKEAVDHFLLSETMQPSELFPFIMRDPNPWTLLVPRNRYWGLHPPPMLLEKVIDDGLMAIQRAIFLKKAGVETIVHDNFISNPPSRAVLLELAIENIIRYLQASRDKDLSPSVREGVDTLLMYLYRALNRVDDMERLACSENSCIVEELETLLNESGHLRTLAFLYSSKGMNSKALTIWHILARNYSSGYIGEITSHDGSTNAHSGKVTAAIEASRILEVSSDQDLVLQHLGWIADTDPLLAVQVLISENREQLLSPDEVIAAIDPKKVDILQRYLQWLIEDQDSDESQFHTRYAILLAKSALGTYETEKVFQNVSDPGSPSTFGGAIRERLQIFLQSSDLYDPGDILDLIEGSELWLEKAILYRKLGQESLVLEILALKLEDCEAAEQYCVEIGRPDAYMQLLELYLDPKNGKEPMFKAAVHLLHNHGESLDPLQVLEKLSSDMPLQLASETLLRMLRARHHHRHQGQIVHNLYSAIDVDVNMARLEERSRHMQINDESLCDSCHARLGTKLFAMYPDDTIVCYKCFRRQGESTSVTGRDFKRDIMFKPGWLVTR